MTLNLDHKYVSVYRIIQYLIESKIVISTPVDGEMKQIMSPINGINGQIINKLFRFIALS